MEERLSIFIFNHGRFGEELIKSAELITGKIDNIQAFSLLPGMSIEDFYETVKEPVQKRKEKNRFFVICLVEHHAM